MKRSNHKRGTRRKESSRRQRWGHQRREVPEILRDARQDLRALVIEHGLEVFEAMLEDDRLALCGPRHEPNPEREAYRYGYDEGVLTFGGRRVRLRKPRVQRKGGSEVELPSWSEHRERDPLERRVVQQMLIGVSTRNYGQSLEGGLPEEARSLCTERSSVSRAFVLRTAQAVREFLGRAVEGKEFPVILIDGKEIGGHVLLIALGVDRQGRKQVLGLEEGTTENTEVCRSLLQNLIARGLEVEHPRLVVIDGGKGLRRAVREVFGQWALVQRCRIHKLRNVLEHLPENRRAAAAAALKRAWGTDGVEAARRELKRLANHLRQEHPGAASSAEEGLEETLTVLALGLTGHLRRLFSSTNMIENVNGTVQQVIGRVRRWRNGQMVVRWAAMGLMAAEGGFRRVQGWRDLSKLMAALEAHKPAAPRRAVNE